MKKLSLIILVLVMVLSLSACGGGDDKSSSSGSETASEESDAPADDRETFGYVVVKLPDGWEYQDRDNDSQVYLEEKDGDKIIQFTLSGPPQESFDEDKKLHEGKLFEPLDDKTFGENTYLAAAFEWNGVRSLSLYTDNPFRPGYGIDVNCFEVDPDDPIIAEILDTVTFVSHEE